MIDYDQELTRDDEDSSTSFYIGLLLAISSTLFIGVSYIIKKKALIKISKQGSVRAGSGGHGYLKEWMWWAGFLMMGLGEVANFAAYTFAPATLVTPLGALSILISAVLSSKFLNEKLNIAGKIGCVLCIIGTTVLVMHSPKEEEVANMNELWLKIQDPIFVMFAVFVIMLIIVLTFFFAPRYGKENIFVYVSLCAAYGPFTVMSCKGLGLAIKSTISGTENDLENWLTWFLLLLVIASIIVQTNYLNKALDLFNAAIVTPIYYILFTTSVLMSSVILFREWEGLDADGVVGIICGFLTVVIAVFLLNGFRDIKLTLKDLRNNIEVKENVI